MPQESGVYWLHLEDQGGWPFQELCVIHAFWPDDYEMVGKSLQDIAAHRELWYMCPNMDATKSSEPVKWKLWGGGYDFWRCSGFTKIDKPEHTPVGVAKL